MKKSLFSKEQITGDIRRRKQQNYRLWQSNTNAWENMGSL